MKPKSDSERPDRFEHFFFRPASFRIHPSSLILHPLLLNDVLLNNVQCFRDHFSVQRQDKAKTGPRPITRLRPYKPLVRFDDALADGQSQSCAAAMGLVTVLD